MCSRPRTCQYSDPFTQVKEEILQYKSTRLHIKKNLHSVVFRLKCCNMQSEAVILQQNGQVSALSATCMVVKSKSAKKKKSEYMYFVHFTPSEAAHQTIKTNRV